MVAQLAGGRLLSDRQVARRKAQAARTQKREAESKMAENAKLRRFVASLARSFISRAKKHNLITARITVDPYGISPQVVTGWRFSFGRRGYTKHSMLVTAEGEVYLDRALRSGHLSSQWHLFDASEASELLERSLSKFVIKEIKDGMNEKLLNS